MPTVVQLQTYGDFDILQTRKVFFTSEDVGVKHLSEFKNDDTPDRIIKELKSLGFKEVKTKSVIYGSD